MAQRRGAADRTTAGDVTTDRTTADDATAEGPAADGHHGNGVVTTGRGPGGRRRVRGPSDKALEREQEIYEAAAELFHRKGYAATTLQDIADAVGLLKGSLYYYIDTKEDLLYHLTRSIHEDARANLEAAQAVDGPPDVRLHALVRGHVASFGRRLTWIRVFYTEHGALVGQRREEIIGDRRRYEDFARGLVEDGQRAGVFCPALDPRIATNAVLTMINTVYLWYRPGRDRLDDVASTYADMAVQSLRCPPGHAHQVGAARKRPRRPAAAG